MASLSPVPSLTRADSLRPRPPRPIESSPPAAKGRQIIPIHRTASITGPADETPERRDRTASKATQRVAQFHRDKTLQEVLEYEETRARTDKQGASETNGYHASHISLAPATRDNKWATTAEKVSTVGVTPKTRRFLAAKQVLTPVQHAVARHPNSPEAVKKLISQLLSPHKRKSVKAGTHLELANNATIGNPREANTFDCFLERVIRPVAEDINARLYRGEIDAMGATKELIGQLKDFYGMSVHNNLRRINTLENFIQSEKVIDAFHEKYAKESDIPQYKFDEYCDAIDDMIGAKEALSISLKGTSTVRDFRDWRNDYQRLASIAKTRNIDAFKAAMVRYQKPVLTVDRQARLARYQAYHREASDQHHAIRLSFNDDSDIENLRVQIFGVFDKDAGKRRKPTTPELHDQVYAMIAPLHPSPAAPARPSAPPADQAPTKLNFDDTDES